MSSLRNPLGMTAVALCALLGAGCVTQGTFDKKVAELGKLRADDARAAAEREAKLDEKIKALEASKADLEKQLGAKGDELAKVQKQLDDANALGGELKGRLEKLGQNVEKLTSEKGQLAVGLDALKKDLEELRRQKAAAEARAATFRNLVAKLRSMIDNGQLKVVIRDGRMLIQLPNDVLFDSGKTDIKPEGQAALVNVAHVLATIKDRHFLVAGHTDNVPIHTSRFPSNWELSTARAVEVVKLMVGAGLGPELVAAAGYGEFDPVVANDTPERRTQNRRIEIILQPNLSDLPNLDNLQASGGE